MLDRNRVFDVIVKKEEQIKIHLYNGGQDG